MFWQKRQKKTRLSNKDIKLGNYISGYKYCSPLMISESDVLYMARFRRVQFRVLLPDGPQGYTIVNIPKKVKTLEDLLEYLNSSGICILKNKTE